MSHSTHSTLSTCGPGNGAVTNVSLFRGATVLLWRNSGTRRQTLRNFDIGCRGNKLTWCWLDVDLMLTWCWLDVDLMLTWCWLVSVVSALVFGILTQSFPSYLLSTLMIGGIMMSNMMWHIVTFSYFNAEPGTHDTKVCQVLSLPIPWCNQRRHMHQPPQWHQSLVTETFVVCGLCGSLNSWPQLATAGHSWP